MALGPRLDLRQSQALVMTPQLQQAIRLLALSNLELEPFLAEAFASNPLLEIGGQGGDEAGDPPDEVPGAGPATASPEEATAPSLLEPGAVGEDFPLDLDPVALDPETGGEDAVALRPGSLAGEPGDGGGRGLAGWEGIGVTATLAEHLHAQAGAAAGSPACVSAAHWLIDQLDEAGYLTVSVDEAARELGQTPGEIEAALALVQSLDPTGIGARNLAECLALQAREADRHDPAMATLLDHLDLLARGSLAQLKRLCGVDDEDMADMLAELRRYDPKPGLRHGQDAVECVEPDILVQAASGGGWDIALNPATLPRLLVDRAYYLELRDHCRDRASRGWLAEKLGEANWLLKALDQRQQTILAVAGEIVRRQEAFLRGGVAHLKPLTLRSVAEAIGVHESTVSRVTSNKYLHCRRGTFELKYFFSSAVAAAGGGGVASASAVKAAIRDLILGEDPKAVLSDDALVELLHERGFDLARRTVAKYREAIGLGNSAQRRRDATLAGLR